jgi:hypothetical protein
VALTKWTDAEEESTAEGAEGDDTNNSLKGTQSHKLMRGISMKAVRANGWTDDVARSVSVSKVRL